VLYCPCKTLEANPKSQKWFIDGNSDSRQYMFNSEHTVNSWTKSETWRPR